MGQITQYAVPTRLEKVSSSINSDSTTDVLFDMLPELKATKSTPLPGRKMRAPPGMWNKPFMTTILCFLEEHKQFKIQLVCRHWYLEVIPQAMQTVDILPEQANAQLKIMLASKPPDLKEANEKLWSKMLPLTPALLHKYWKLVEPEERMTDTSQAEYANWNQYGSYHAGMRHSTSGKEHGIVRLVRYDGNIAEHTEKFGCWHGLERWIIDGHVHIQLY